MKPLTVFPLVLGLAGICLGDIQDPPANDYGPIAQARSRFREFSMGADRNHREHQQS